MTSNIITSNGNDISELFNLLRTESGVNDLRNGGMYVGIHIKTDSYDNMINFGHRMHSDMNIENPAPIGYEECNDTVYYISKMITVEIDSESWSPPYFKLLSSTVLPEPRQSTFKLELINSSGDDAVGCCIDSGSTINFYVKLSVKKNYEGNINSWMIFSFEGTKHHSKACVTTSKCMISLRIYGSVFGSASSGLQMPSSLSADAKPFFSESHISYFNTKCLQTTYCDGFIETSPPGFKTLLDFVEYYTFKIPDDVRKMYDETCKSGNWQHAMKYLQIINVSPQPHDTPYREIPAHIQYTSNISKLTWSEQLQQERDVCLHDMRNVPLHFEFHQEGYLSFEIVVHGSSENRPRIQVGDILRLRPTAQSLIISARDLPFAHGAAKKASVRFGIFELEAVVYHYDLRNEKVRCYCMPPSREIIVPIIGSMKHQYNENVHKFLGEIHQGFHTENMMIVLRKLKFHIRFQLEEHSYIFAHKALCSLLNSEIFQKRLYPSNKYRFPPETLPVLRGHCILNREQQEAALAVSRLCAKVKGSHNIPLPVPPYIIYGPPGTGKTTTLIAVINEVCQRSPGTRILACAPSDAACDVIARRLSERYSPTQMLRLNWWKRMLASVPPMLLKYCCLYRDTTFDIPDIYTLLNYEIIVCTVSVAGALQYIMDSISFDLVIIDEVTQAPEANCLIPLSFLCPTGVCVLAGDPEQMGPNLRSPLYHMTDCRKSLLERLLQFDTYKDVHPKRISETQSDGAIAIKKLGVFLARNYRSQCSIFKLSSELFYNGSLIESGDIEDLDSLKQWEELRGSKVVETAVDNIPRPCVVLFRAVTGTHWHNIDSPSFYNTAEVEAVVGICQSLLNSSSIDVSTKDIGVIGAFRSQVLKLRIALRKAHMSGINVGGVEDFQGQECRVVVISTVLSQRIPSLEVNGGLGLIGDHRRFNVAVTRGRHLVVVVGHPYCLHTDANWQSLMNYCYRCGTFTGCKFPLLDSSQRDVNQELLNEAAMTSLMYHSSENYGDFTNILDWRGLL